MKRYTLNCWHGAEMTASVSLTFDDKDEAMTELSKYTHEDEYAVVFDEDRPIATSIIIDDVPPKIDLRAKARKDYLPLEMDGSVSAPKFAEPRINRVMIFISKDMFTPSNVSVSLDDDPRVIKLFDFEPKEISFSNAELVGLTAKEARELYHKKDVAYLQSPWI